MFGKVDKKTRKEKEEKMRVEGEERKETEYQSV